MYTICYQGEYILFVIKVNIMYILDMYTICYQGEYIYILDVYYLLSR